MHRCKGKIGRENVCKIGRKGVLVKVEIVRKLERCRLTGFGTFQTLKLFA